MFAGVFGAGLMLASGVAAVSAEMPKAFSELRLGMSEQEVRTLRPDATAFDIFGEPEEVSEDAPNLMIEFLGEDPFFDSVDFTFVGGQLCIVKWIRLRPADDFAALRAGLLQGAIRKWGKTYERVALPFGLPSDTEGDAPATETAVARIPGLRWQLGDAEVLVGYSPSGQAADAAPAGDLLQLAIFRRACLGALADDMDLGAMTDLTDLPPGLFQDLETKATGALFE